MSMIDKKGLRSQYKARSVVSGICALRSKGSGKMLIEASTDIAGSKNRFEFMKMTNTCPSMKLQKEWNAGEEFEFIVLEELGKQENQTDAEFAQDIKTLLEIWEEKQSSGAILNK